MKIAVTGGTGFIGSHFLKQALAAGHAVRAIRRSHASQPRITIGIRSEWLNGQLDEVSVEDLYGCEVLVHFAAHSVQYPFDTMANCLRWNLNAVLALFEKARLAGIKRYIVAGSCFEYGRTGEHYDFIPTDALLEPTNSYAVSKAAATIALCQWAEEYQLSLEVLRVFHVYGEGEAKTRFWPSLRRAAIAGEDFPMTEGHQIRDFIPVEKVASLFLERSMKRDFDDCNIRIYNVGTGEPCSLVSFAQHWWTIWNAKGNLLAGAVPYRGNECMRFVPGERLLRVSR
jgi:nucleoside-diphosphate-sugar epimerase